MSPIFIGMLSNVMTAVTTNRGACEAIWSRLNNICWGITKLLFTDIALVRFEMVTPDYPQKLRIPLRVFSALWYGTWLIVIQSISVFVGCQMFYALMPLYPIYTWQLAVDVVASGRFLFVLSDYRRRKSDMSWISLIVDLCVFATLVVSTAEAVLLLSELPKPLAEINFVKILEMGTSDFIVVGALYCIMSVYSKLEKRSGGSNKASAIPTSDHRPSLSSGNDQTRIGRPVKGSTSQAPKVLNSNEVNSGV
ncbi:hypothetical protein HDU93_003527 [Gonapodya sp. JEL0774]|nr:hypothetical protein HDU93_003527 [Gonapodya sp. JEL0774]